MLAGLALQHFQRELNPFYIGGYIAKLIIPQFCSQHEPNHIVIGNTRGFSDILREDSRHAEQARNKFAQLVVPLL